MSSTEQSIDGRVGDGPQNNSSPPLQHGEVERRVIAAHGTNPAVSQKDPGAPDSLSARFASFLDTTLNADQGSSAQPTSNDNATPGQAQGQLLLPLPTANANKSQISIATPDEETVMELDLENLPPEIATADITMASMYLSHSLRFSRAHSLQTTTVSSRHPQAQRRES